MDGPISSFEGMMELYTVLNHIEAPILVALPWKECLLLLVSLGCLCSSNGQANSINVFAEVDGWADCLLSRHDGTLHSFEPH